MKNGFFYKTALFAFMLLLFAALPVCRGLCAKAKSDAFNPETPCSVELDFSSSEYDFPDKTEILFYKIADYVIYNEKPEVRYAEKYNQLPVSISDIVGKEAAAKVKDYIVKNNISQDFSVLTEGRKATTSNLQSGIYFIMKRTSDKDKLDFPPFTVCLPAYSTENGEYVYSVISKPKVAVCEGKSEIIKPTGEKLPQTGQLWWPAIALAVLGITLIACAYFIKILL